MSKKQVHLINFKAGELSPYLDVRTEVNYYSNAAKTIKNLIIWQHGGLTKRPGTQHIWGDSEMEGT